MPDDQPRYLICERPTNPGETLYRGNDVRERIRPLWLCLDHFQAVKLRPPNHKTERVTPTLLQAVALPGP
jgi:hypothetical protein